MVSIMTFSDEDLKRLKEETEEDSGVNHDMYLRRDKFEALIKRLDAAEEVANQCYTECPCEEPCTCGYGETMKAWRATKGEL